jgi:hypothetical protein
MTTRFNWAKAHRVYADFFKLRFHSLWGRELTAEEILILENAPFCFSGMMLEVVERDIMNAKSESDADEQFNQISEAVSKHGAEILQRLKAAAKDSRVSLDLSPGSSLLAIEEFLVEKLG